MGQGVDATLITVAEVTATEIYFTFNAVSHMTLDN